MSPFLTVWCCGATIAYCLGLRNMLQDATITDWEDWRDPCSYIVLLIVLLVMFVLWPLFLLIYLLEDDLP